MNGESFGESTKSFSYDFSYDSMNSTSPNFVTQEKVHMPSNNYDKSVPALIELAVLMFIVKVCFSVLSISS